MWCAIYFPHLGLEVFQRRRVDRSPMPMVLLDNHRVCLANQAAQDSGVALGMSLATAYSINTELQHYTRDIETEVQRLKSLVVTGYRFTPVVCCADPDVMLLNVSGSLQLFKGWDPLHRDIHKSFLQHGHLTSIGVAHTPRAAVVLAKANLMLTLSAFPTEEELRAQSMSQLKQADMTCTELQAKTIESLHNMGLYTVGSILDLPRHELNQRFAPEFTQYFSQLTGEIDDVWDLETPKEQFHESLHLLEPVLGKQELLSPMEHLTLELSDWLRSRHLGLQEAEWSLTDFTGKCSNFRIQFTQPHTSQQTMLSITNLKLERVELPEEVTSISLRVMRTQLLSAVANKEIDLFGNEHRHSNRAHHDLLDRLATRLGNESLQMLKPLDDHRPERAWASSMTQTRRSTVPRATLTRPLWLFEPPLSIKPKNFEILRGPERIQCGWWDSNLDRDYFVARHESGSLCWIFLENDMWFQHGYFA